MLIPWAVPPEGVPLAYLSTPVASLSRDCECALLEYGAWHCCAQQLMVVGAPLGEQRENLNC